jgi:MOSC domain-containing protein YiiM
LAGIDVGMTAGAAVAGRLRAVLVGTARPFARAGVVSAIDKRCVDGSVLIGTEGLESDEQGDRNVHGGPDKAVHCYAWQHYASWQRELPACPIFQAPGAFGENFSVEVLDETLVCLGDQWQVGTALVEVSQGRQPCWKLNHRFEVSDMAARVQRTLRAGWYLRVLQPGMVVAGAVMVLKARPHAAWSIARLLSIISERDCNPALLEEVLALPLTPSWRKPFSCRLESGAAENWASRLTGLPRS